MWRKLAGVGLAMALAFSVTQVASARHGGGGREGGHRGGLGGHRGGFGGHRGDDFGGRRGGFGGRRGDDFGGRRGGFGGRRGGWAGNRGERQWHICTATDRSGSGLFFMGMGRTRAEAYTRAFETCQRQNRSCFITCEIQM